MTIRHFCTRVVLYPLLGLSVTALLISLGIEADLSKSDWASWVQAVGSITALGVAIFVMSRQNKHSAKLIADADRLTTLRRARSVHAVLFRALVIVLKVDPPTRVIPNTPGKLSDLKLHLEWATDALSDLLRDVRGIPTYDLGSYEMAAGVHAVIDALESLHGSFKYLGSQPGEAGAAYVVERHKKAFATLKAGFKEFQKGMEDLKQLA